MSVESVISINHKNCTICVVKSYSLKNQLFHGFFSMNATDYRLENTVLEDLERI